MINPNNPGRIIGALFLSQLIGGILVNFFLTAPLFGEPGFLVNGALYATQIGASAIIGIVISSFSVVIAILAYPLFKEHSKSLALGFLTLSSISLVLSAVEQMGVLSMVSYSKAYAGLTVAADQAIFESMRGIVANLRNWGHYTNQLFGGATLIVFYIALFRTSFVPKALAGFGILAAASQLTSVALPFLGHSVNFQMLAPIGLAQISLSLWLLIKGFKVQS
jgi:hypothetical protein